MISNRPSSRFFTHSVLCFLAVCQTKSFTQAAEILKTSQSSVSRAITDLEAYLGGTCLVDRHTRPVRITKSGLELEYSLSRYQGELDEILFEIKNNNFLRFPLHIGIVESMAEFLTHSILSCLHSNYSNAKVLTAVSTRLLDLLDNGTVDFIVSSNSFSHRNDLQRIFLLQEPSLIITPRTLVLKQPLTWHSLQYCGLPQIAYDIGNSGAAMERRLFNENGLKFVRKIEVDLNALLMSMVSKGMGWALTRGSTLVQFPQYINEVNVYEMPDPLASREVFLIYKNEALTDKAIDIATVIQSVFIRDLIPKMSACVPWIKAYLKVRGSGLLERVNAYPEEVSKRQVTVF